MGLTDPNLVFWEKFWLNFARIENKLFFDQNLLIWAETVLRSIQSIFIYMHNIGG